MNLRQIYLILRLRWWLVLLVFIVSVVGTYVVSIFLPKQYTANTTLLLDVKADPLIATLMPTMSNPAFIATQMEIIRSDRVAGRVVKLLGMEQNPAAVSAWRESTQGRIPITSYYGDLLQGGLSIDVAKNSTILNLGYTGTDPKFAATVANTFAKAYIDTTVELRQEPTRQYAGFYDDRYKALRADFEAAQARLSAFQQSKGIVSDDRVDQESTKLATLSAQLAGAQAERADTVSRERNAGTATSIDVQQSGAVQNLRAELSRQETKLTEISSVVGSNHPTRIALEAQIANLKQQIAAEMRVVSGTTSTVNRVNSAKIGELQALVDAQKKTVLGLRAERDEMAVLLKDVETAQRAYDAVAQRRSQLSLETQSDQSTVRTLSPAVEPIRASRPRIDKNVMVAAILGLALGVAVAMGVELLDRRVRGETDLFVIEGIPVLGVLSEKPTNNWYAHRIRTGLLAGPQMPQLTLEGGAR